jgi:5-(carboxyamino)imidazole ribonucleotide synthase
MMKKVFPSSTIGIIGGGQLGRMMAMSAKAMGYKVAVLDPAPNSPCGQVSDIEIVANYDDLEAIKKLDSVSDVITYEFENIDAAALAYLEKEANLPQGSKVLKISQNRYLEKQTIRSFGIPVAPFSLVRTLEDLHSSVTYPSVLKTTTGGYDGKGQVVLRSETDLEKCYQLVEQQECILEKWVPFTKEISVIVTRSILGEIAILPVAENIHRNNILHQTIVPARISSELEEKAKKIGLEIAKKLEVIGTLAIELFVTEDEIYVNELAPRPHNSGHFSMDACQTGQFEQHIRAVCGLPLGKTKLEKTVVLTNILGQHMVNLERINSLLSFSKLHLYGKEEAKENRKMGHLNTFVEKNLEETFTLIDDTEIWDERLEIGK